MAELVYAFDLKSNEETRAGSSPAPGTTTEANASFFYCRHLRITSDAQNYNPLKLFGSNTNRNHLLFVQSTENFYKLFEHSALFYNDGLADKIGKSARIMPDDDFCDRSSIGYLSHKDAKHFEKHLFDSLGWEYPF